MKGHVTLNPLWAGFLDLLRSIFIVEIGLYLYCDLSLAGELLP